ncbi:ABC transporter ATP-binding protein, partial [Syntrophomonas wolfei]|uniref:ATP-binding cassette domain-containing protein n=1 Tax=Syntrophomonas wolfei TaxID=863 RepID=UPI0023F011F1
VSMSLLQVVEAGFGYEKQEIFRKLNFQVEKGEVFCLLGPNGCGKTTLLDCILGVRQLNAGKILLNGQDIKAFRSGQIARYIAYVPQSHERT